MKFRQVFMKLILIILAINVIFMMCISNKSLATETWDEFYQRFLKETTRDGSVNNLSDEDVQRMINGPTKEERGNPGATDFIDSMALQSTQPLAIELKESRLESGTWGLDANGDRIEGTDDNNDGENINNEERSKKAKELRKEITDFYYGTNLSKYNSVSVLKNYREKLKKYRSYGGEMDETMLIIHNAIEDRLTELGEERDNSYYDSQVGSSSGLSKEEEQEKEDGKMTGQLGNSDPSASHTVDEIMNEADGFLNTGKEETVPVNGENVRVGSGILYNILLAIAVVAAVVIGLYLGIKFMMSSAEDRAKVKEALIPYIAGCVVIFASFTIWKLVISILGNVA